MHTTRISIAAALLMLFVGTEALSAPSLNVSLNKNQMSLSEYLVLQIEFEVKGGAQDPTLKPPPLVDWERIRVETSGTQQSISIINGQVSRSLSKSERWILKPLRSGRLPVGAFELRGSDGIVRSPLRHVRVFGTSSSSARKRNRANSSDTRKAGEPITAPMSIEERIFLRWKFSDSSPFVGEPMMAHLELVYDPRLRPTHSSGLEQLDFSGFWTQKIDQPEQREWLEDVKGAERRVQRLISYRLIPLDTRERSLPAVSMDVELSSISRRSGSFLGRQRLVPWGEVTAKSEAVLLKIQSLPKVGRPQPFPKTSVGQATLRAKLSQRKVRADSGVDLIIETATDGLLQNFPEIEILELPDFDIYPSQTTTSTDLNRNGSRRGDDVIVRNVRRQRFLLRPRRTGRLKLPAFELPYFNPKTERYQTARTRPLAVDVSGVVPTQTAEGTKQTKASKRQDDSEGKKGGFRPLSRTYERQQGSHWLGNMTVFYGFAFGLPSLLGMVLLLRRRRSHLDATRGDRSAAAALKSAHTALNDLKIENAVDLKEKAKRTKQIALRYLEQRTQRNLMGFAYDELASELATSGIKRKTLSRFIELLETLDYESFSGTLSGGSFEAQANEILSILSEFERSMEGR